MKRRIVSILLCSATLLGTAYSQSASGYRALIGCEEGFLAAGSAGRVDRIGPDGALKKTVQLAPVELRALLAFDSLELVAGASGSLFCAINHTDFLKVETGTDDTIFCLARFKGRILAGSEEGLLLETDATLKFKTNRLAVEGNLVSLSANESDCFGVTDKGEIVHSTDGIQWSILDFNEYYAGYYPACRFVAVLAMEHQIAIIGVHLDGTPALLLSNGGTVWGERTLSYSDSNGRPGMLTELPTSLCYDAEEDQLFLTCTKGTILSVPACSHCNKMLKVSETDLTGIAQKDFKWLVVGHDFYSKFLGENW